ncbi:unnamed protein product [Fasciola hepatica]|uniref:Uncharacterized protein n=2 Tax=Fasciola hepatica TaxID=6192 RepID=A0ABC9HIN8_FASHE|nr:hypothetical protein D915_000464 [Fasciola hepatica]CAK6928360.1 unnamed protein product [Fasciola hepatica]
MNKKDALRSSVDICDLILNYVKDFPIPKEVKSRCNVDNLKSTDMDFSRLQIINKETTHLPSTAGSAAGLANGLPESGHSPSRSFGGMKQKMNSHVLFSSVFTNRTSETQTNHLRTERRTSATCRISMQKSVCKEGSLTLQIGPPGPVIQANGGFRREVQMSREHEKVFEEELVWSVDTEVIVPPGSRTTAELVITEDEYDGKFRVETIFSGSITVRLRDKRDGSEIYVIRLNDLTRVFTAEYGFQPVTGQPGSVCFINEGQCHCHFGIGQQVMLHQEKI